MVFFFKEVWVLCKVLTAEIFGGKPKAFSCKLTKLLKASRGCSIFGSRVLTQIIRRHEVLQHCIPLPPTRVAGYSTKVFTPDTGMHIAQGYKCSHDFIKHEDQLRIATKPLLLKNEKNTINATVFKKQQLVKNNVRLDIKNWQRRPILMKGSNIVELVLIKLIVRYNCLLSFLTTNKSNLA